MKFYIADENKIVKTAAIPHLLI